MGLGNFVRNRKQVKADRAESGSHQKLVAALGGSKNYDYSKSNVQKKLMTDEHGAFIVPLSANWGLDEK